MTGGPFNLKQGSHAKWLMFIGPGSVRITPLDKDNGGHVTAEEKLEEEEEGERRERRYGSERMGGRGRSERREGNRK